MENFYSENVINAKKRSLKPNNGVILGKRICNICNNEIKWYSIVGREKTEKDNIYVDMTPARLLIKNDTKKSDLIQVKTIIARCLCSCNRCKFNLEYNVEILIEENKKSTIIR